MALSPIKMFENSQSSLAQILQGGNQTISGIMDKAIQIGRDISNKQLAQERDLLAMRQQETNLFQRRAENLQQNIEDAQNFSRRAFESDRRYGLEQQQEQRAGVKDLFAMGDTTRRTDLAERGVEVQEGSLEARKAEAEAERVQADRIAQQNLTLAGGGGDTAAPTEKPVKDLFWQPEKPMSPVSARPTEEVSKTATVPGVSEAEVRFEAAKRTGNPDLITKRGAELDAAKAAASTTSPTSRYTDPDIAAKRKLDLLAAQRKETDVQVKGAVEGNKKAFPPSASGYVSELQQIAAEKGKKPEEVLWSADFPKQKRDAIIAAQEGQAAIELNAINSAASEDAYVNLLPGAGEAEKAERRRVYRLVKSGKTDTASPGAAAEDDPWDAIKKAVP